MSINSNINGNTNGAQPAMPKEKRTKQPLWVVLVGVLVFLLKSAGYILQAIAWSIFGKTEKELKGGVAVVTGGGGGLGRLLALRLARLQCNVVLWDINQEALDETCKLVNSMGGICKGYKVDLADRQDVYRVAKLVKEDFGRVTLLINNAGLVSGKMFLETPDYMIQRTFDVNILAHFWTSKAFLPEMVEANEGHIVTIASLAGHVGVAKLVDYCSSKFAAVGFDEALRAELETMKVDGVHTTVICPFFIRSTGMFEDVHARFIPQLNSNDVADRIIKAVRTNEKFAIVPGYLQMLLAVKWMFPWGCVSDFLKGLVPDAVPEQTPVKLAEPKVETTQTYTKEDRGKSKTESVPVRRTTVQERQP